MVFVTDAVDHRLDCRVQKFRDQHEDAHRQQYGELDGGLSQQDGDRYEENANRALLSKSRLVGTGCPQALPRVVGRMEDSLEACFAQFHSAGFLQPLVFGSIVRAVTVFDLNRRVIDTEIFIQHLFHADHDVCQVRGLIDAGVQRE